MRSSDKIKKWFSDNVGGSLLFPDGWYGRPHDSIHQLTDILENDDKIIFVELDKILKLSFTDVSRIDIDRDQIVIAFARLCFEWEGYGHPELNGSKEYLDGELRIVR